MDQGIGRHKATVAPRTVTVWSMRRTLPFLAAALLATSLLTGCGGNSNASGAETPTVHTIIDPGPQSAKPTATPTPTQTATPAPQATPTPTPTPEPTPEKQCADLTGEQALATWAPEVPQHEGSNWPWALEDSDPTTYDPCADMSWIVLCPPATRSTPCHIMLFHAGEYIGTATYFMQAFYPGVERIDDGQIEVTYQYSHPWEEYPAATGRAKAQFTWDPATQSSVMTGETGEMAREREANGG